MSASIRKAFTLQYSLRLFLVVTVGLGAFLSAQIKIARDQSRVALRLRQQGARADMKPMVIGRAIPFADGYFQKVVALSMVGCEIHETEANLLAELTYLESLILCDCQFRGSLQSLPGLPRLKRFVFSDTDAYDADYAFGIITGSGRLEHIELRGVPVNDDELKRLRGLERLRTVKLYRTDVSPQALQRFRVARPGCTIAGS